MEVSMWETCRIEKSKKQVEVLILVCVEVSMWVASLCDLTPSGRTVLILVCVEVSMWDIAETEKIDFEKNGLNPCLCGS